LRPETLAAAPQGQQRTGSPIAPSLNGLPFGDRHDDGDRAAMTCDDRALSFVGPGGHLRQLRARLLQTQGCSFHDRDSIVYSTVQIVRRAGNPPGRAAQVDIGRL
jgi:hypothetical protein